MIIVAGRIYVRPGTREQFLALSAESLVKARSTGGCRDFIVAPDPLEADRVNIYEEWDSREQLLAFRGDGPGTNLSALMEKTQVSEYSVSPEETCEHTSR